MSLYSDKISISALLLLLIIVIINENISSNVNNIDNVSNTNNVSNINSSNVSNITNSDVTNYKFLTNYHICRLTYNLIKLENSPYPSHCLILNDKPTNLFEIILTEIILLL